jgi:guanylate kinase
MKSILGITGVSASGKSTLCTNLCKEPEFAPIISHTTRAMRHGEKNGEAYYFVSKSHFNGLIPDMVEHITLYENQYGGHIAEFERIWKAGKVPIVILDPDGLRQVAEYCSTHSIRFVSIYMENELNILTERYLSRLTPGVNLDLKYHALRICAIKSEKDEWRKSYDEIRNLYNLRGAVVGNYSATTQDIVHSNILSMFREEFSLKNKDNGHSYYQLQQDTVNWANETFGGSNQNTVIRKLVMSEIPELVLALSQDNNDKIKDEMADVVILFMDLSYRLGVDILAEVAKKMEINRKRKWITDKHGVSRHV